MTIDTDEIDTLVDALRADGWEAHRTDKPVFLYEGDSKTVCTEIVTGDFFEHITRKLQIEPYASKHMVVVLYQIIPPTDELPHLLRYAYWCKN